jgi:tetraacyldisaccharide 4'-kinase
MHAPEFWNSNQPIAKAWATLLSPIGALYGLSVQARRLGTKPFRSAARVLCVGNLTAGGAGKTQVAIALGRMLKARGKRIVFLTRGYGGRLAGPVVVDLARHLASDVGDEPLLLAGNAPTVVAHDRARGAKLAEAIGAEIIVMDDGHQNFQLAKDLSLVVVDASLGVGNGKLIPAGPLRERAADGLARADALVLMGRGSPSLPRFDGPTFRAHATPLAPDAIRGQAVFAFAGIANPERFFALLQETGANVMGRQSFADHHRYSALEISALKLAAEKLGARLVTTEKDFVRCDPGKRDCIMPVPVCAIFDDGAGVACLLDRLGSPGQRASA